MIPVLILHGTDDKATNPSGSQFFYDNTGSTDKTLKLYEGHYHDLLNDVDKEVVMADINNWINARVPEIQTKSVGATNTGVQAYDSDLTPLVLWTDR